MQNVKYSEYFSYRILNYKKKYSEREKERDRKKKSRKNEIYDVTLQFNIRFVERERDTLRFFNILKKNYI